jgi:hypothetical protein
MEFLVIRAFVGFIALLGSIFLRGTGDPQRPGWLHLASSGGAHVQLGNVALEITEHTNHDQVLGELQDLELKSLPSCNDLVEQRSGLTRLQRFAPYVLILV